MIDEWFYSHADAKVGPCSGRQLKDLAASGHILPTDSIWKGDIERSVLASKVKNLFASSPITPQISEPILQTMPTLEAVAVPEPSPRPPVSANLSETLMLLGQTELVAKDHEPGDTLEETMRPSKSEGQIPPDLELRAIEEVPPLHPIAGWQTKPGGQGRATAGKGAIIVGQDGTNVQFRKKCTTCGHEDNCRSRMPIRQGTTKVGFYCSKCRKRREVEIQGFAK
jgi:hypothetical protein